MSEYPCRSVYLLNAEACDEPTRADALRDVQQSRRNDCRAACNAAPLRCRVVLQRRTVALPRCFATQRFAWRRGRHAPAAAAGDRAWRNTAHRASSTHVGRRASSTHVWPATDLRRWSRSCCPRRARSCTARCTACPSCCAAGVHPQGGAPVGAPPGAPRGYTGVPACRGAPWVPPLGTPWVHRGTVNRGVPLGIAMGAPGCP